MGVIDGVRTKGRLVDRYINTAYDVVKCVADNMAALLQIKAWLDGGGSGQVDSVVAGENITVDNSDPINPIIAASGGGATATPIAVFGELDDITSDINTTADKVSGYAVWDDWGSRPVWANQSGAGSIWQYADGSTAHTPS